MHSYEFDYSAPDGISRLAGEDTDARPDLDLTIVRRGPDVPELYAAPEYPIVASPDRRPGAASYLAGKAALEGMAAAGDADETQPAITEAVPDDDVAAEPTVTTSDSPGPPSVPSETAVGPSELPDPKEVARRVAQITGDADMDPATRFDGGELADVFFDVNNGEDVGTANVIVRRVARTRVVQRGRQVPLWVEDTWTTVGHYDPAIVGWKFYDEFIQPQEQAGAAGTFETLALFTAEELAEPSFGTPLIDLRHPVTVEARREMAGYLETSGLGRNILERAARGGNERLTYDAATSATFVLTPMAFRRVPGTHEYEDQPEQYLTVAYRGLLLHQGMYTERGDRQATIAVRSDFDQDIWLPDPDLVTFEEWGRIAAVPATLMNYRYHDRDFSTERCAVVRDGDYRS